MDVTVPLRSGYGPAWRLDRRLTLWLVSLAALAVVNAGLWIWMSRSPSLRTPYAEAQLFLSGVYVAICGFRSLFPHVDLERVCLWDTWLSAIFLGRTLATVAELCFAAQCGLFVLRLAELTGEPVLATAAAAFVPIALVAEVCCWYSVVSLNHAGHAIEESLWAGIMLILAAACGVAALSSTGSLRALLVVGAVVYVVGAAVTAAFDVRMYVRRWRARTAHPRLSIATGLRDSHARREPTAAWDVWREEVPWMTLYFSIGVWTSLAMVLLAWA